MFALAFLLITLAHSQDNIVYLQPTDATKQFEVFKFDSQVPTSTQDNVICFQTGETTFIKFTKQEAPVVTEAQEQEPSVVTETKYIMTDHSDGSCGSSPSGTTELTVTTAPQDVDVLFSIKYSNVIATNGDGGENIDALKKADGDPNPNTNQKTFQKLILKSCINKQKYEMTNLGAFKIQYENTKNVCEGKKVNIGIDYYLGNSPSYATYTISVFTPTVDFVQQDPLTVTQSKAVKKTLDAGKTTLDGEYALIFSDTEGYWMTDNEIGQQNKLYPVNETDEFVLATIKHEDNIQTIYIFSSLNEQNNQQCIIFGKHLIVVQYEEGSQSEGKIIESSAKGTFESNGGNSTVDFTEISSEKTYYEVQGTSGYGKYKTGVCEKKSDNEYFMFDNVKSAHEGVIIARVEGMAEGCKPAPNNKIALLNVTETKPSSIGNTVREIDTNKQCTVTKTEDTAIEVQYMVIDNCMVVSDNEVKKITVENNKVITYNYTSPGDCNQNINAIKNEYGTCNTCNKGEEKGFILICDTSNYDSSSEPKVNDVSSNQPKINDDSSSQTKMNNDSSTNNKPPSPPPSSGASPSSMFITMLLVIFVFLF